MDTDLKQLTDMLLRKRLSKDGIDYESKSATEIMRVRAILIIHIIEYVMTKMIQVVPEEHLESLISLINQSVTGKRALDFIFQVIPNSTVHINQALVDFENEYLA